MKLLMLVVTIFISISCSQSPTHVTNEMHMKILAQHQANPYPSPDKLLLEELYENEQQLAYEIADEAMYTVDRNYDEQLKQASRDAHPKENGCVEGEFHVDNNLSPRLAKGVFASGQAYKALIRFSNSNENPKGNDHDSDARGMAIKLMSALQETHSKPIDQDFIMINHPVFILDDPSDYLSLVHAQNSSSWLAKLRIPFALGFRGMYNAYHTIFQDQIKNPLLTQYYSMVPYRLGKESDPERKAIKFTVREYPNPGGGQSTFPILGTSCVNVESHEPNQDDENYLRTALRQTLLREDGEKESHACMEFLIQVATKDMSVENTQIEWEDEAESAFTSVALIKIPRHEQPFDDTKSTCEDLSFNPWHAQEEHRPLGVVNRLRKVIYPIVSEYRNTRNKLGEQVTQ